MGLNINSVLLSVKAVLYKSQMLDVSLVIYMYVCTKITLSLKTILVLNLVANKT